MPIITVVRYYGTLTFVGVRRRVRRRGVHACACALYGGVTDGGGNFSVRIGARASIQRGWGCFFLYFRERVCVWGGLPYAVVGRLPIGFGLAKLAKMRSMMPACGGACRAWRESCLRQPRGTCVPSSHCDRHRQSANTRVVLACVNVCGYAMPGGSRNDVAPQCSLHGGRGAATASWLVLVNKLRGEFVPGDGVEASVGGAGNGPDHVEATA